jgi:hypothetical protein
MKSHRFKIGERVKLMRIPPQVRRDKQRFPETFLIFRAALGNVFQVRGFDEYSHVELWLQEDGAEDKKGVAHSVWVEPEFLKTAG